MRSFLKLSVVQFKLFLREPVAFFFTLIFPLLLLTLFGLVWGNEPAAIYGGFGYIDQAVPGLAAVIIGTIALMSVPVATAAAREQKILRRFRATPMRAQSYLAAQVVVYLVLALAGMALLIVAASLFFGLRFAGNWFAVTAAFVFCTVSFVAVGYLIAGLAPTSRVAQVAGQLIFFPLMFLSGATIPLQVMPDGVRQAAEWLPMTQLVLLLQGLWFGQGWNLPALAMMAVLLVVGALLATPAFRWE